MCVAGFFIDCRRVFIEVKLTNFLTCYSKLKCGDLLITVVVVVVEEKRECNRTFMSVFVVLKKNSEREQDRGCMNIFT